MKLSELVDRWLHWLTSASHNLRSFAVLRILYGIALLVTYVPSWQDRSLIWGASSFWVDPEAKRRGYFTFDLLFPKEDRLVFDVMFLALTALIVLFIVGYRARLVTVLLLVLVVSIQSNNGYVLNGGDTLIRITLLFLVFANLSAHYSIDAWRANRREARAEAAKTSKGTGKAHRSFVPRTLVHGAHNMALVLCCFQIVVVYTVSGIWKLTGDEWPAGTALFYSLRIDTFMVYPMINELLWQSTLLIYVATFIALWTQTLFPVLVLWRPTRIFALVALVFMHTGIGLLLGLWPFSLVMIALDMLFIRDTTWKRVTERLRDTELWARGADAAADLRARIPLAR